MHRKTFQKNKERKLKEVVQELKHEISKLQKENEFLKKELQDKIGSSKSKSTQKQTPEEWKKDFLNRLKKEVWDKK